MTNKTDSSRVVYAIMFTLFIGILGALALTCAALVLKEQQAQMLERCKLSGYNQVVVFGGKEYCYTQHNDVIIKEQVEHLRAQ